MDFYFGEDDDVYNENEYNENEEGYFQKNDIQYEGTFKDLGRVNETDNIFTLATGGSRKEKAMRTDLEVISDAIKLKFTEGVFSELSKTMKEDILTLSLKVDKPWRYNPATMISACWFRIINKNKPLNRKNYKDFYDKVKNEGVNKYDLLRYIKIYLKV